ncbi:MAG TPA: HD domain-containing protein [Verrucomicrobiae bacterium]|nr:HD domain-containing protein [Verrucomicrobiae bacterium]
MKVPTRRTFLAAPGCLCYLDDAAEWKLPPLGAEIAGIRAVDSRFTRLAVEALVDCSPPFLVNHAMRTFYFGALVGRRQKLSFDAEVFFLACALHDLGLTQKHEGSLPFEIQGAETARKILSAAGLTADQAEIVWDGIAMHPQPISNFKRPEISLVGAGAGVDVVGGIGDLPADGVKAIVAAFPRLQFKQQFVRTCGEVANRHPGAARHTFMRDIAERTNPAYKVSNICDAIAKAAFSE